MEGWFCVVSHADEVVKGVVCIRFGVDLGFALVTETFVDFRDK